MKHASLLVPFVAVLAATTAGCGSGGGSAAQSLTVTLSDAGCSPTALKATSGPLKVNVVNSGSSAVTEAELTTQNGTIIGEKENVVPGVDGDFTVSLDPGTYKVSCPGGDDTDAALVVSGTATTPKSKIAAPTLTAATNGYHSYVVRQSGELLGKTQQFVAALQAGDLQGAKDLFGPTRLAYESIEPVAESFGALDPELDARAGDVPAADWTGFHHIEQILWEKNTTAGTEALGVKLLADVKKLDTKVQTLQYQPFQLANGAVELLNEVASSKITGEEDRYSHTDLSDFQGNLSGSRAAFELLIPALKEAGEGGLADTITTRFDKVQGDLDKYKRPTALGFALYSELTPQDRRAFAQDVEALAEPLSTVAAKVTT